MRIIEKKTMRILSVMAFALLIVSCSLVRLNPESRILGRWEGTNVDNAHVTLIFTPDHIVHSERYRSDYASTVKSLGTWKINNGLYSVTAEGQTVEGGIGADGMLHLLEKESDNTLTLTKVSKQTKFE